LRRAREIFGTYVPTLWLFWKIDRLRRRIQRDPLSRSYSDLAIAAVDSNDELLELYNATEAARQAVAKAKARGTNLRPAIATR